jgi:glutamate 5-kinase
MITKIVAGKIATLAGVHMLISSGKIEHPLKALYDGGPSTWFHAHGNPVTSYKRWIAGALKATGELVIDDGAVKALKQGKSLLPAGITQLSGRFERGDAVIVRDLEGREIARGLVGYCMEEAARIIGCQSSQIHERLGYEGRAAVIHRDDMVLFTGADGERI